MENNKKPQLVMILAMLNLQLSDWTFLGDRLAEANADQTEVDYCQKQANRIREELTGIQS